MVTDDNADRALAILNQNGQDADFMGDGKRPTTALRKGDGMKDGGTGLRRRNQFAGAYRRQSRGQNAPTGKLPGGASKPGVYALERAAKAGIVTAVVRRKDYRQRGRIQRRHAAYLQATASRQWSWRASVHCGAERGAPIPNRMMNVHPALIPNPSAGPGTDCGCTKRR